MALVSPQIQLELQSRPSLLDNSNLHLLILGFVSVSVSLGTAVAAIGRLCLYLLVLWFIVRRPNAKTMPLSLAFEPWYKRWEWMTIAAVAYMGCTVLWTSVEWELGIWAWSEHARLITIPAVYLLINSAADARNLLRVFLFSQLFVVFSSWLLIANVEVPWALAEHAQRDFEVFGTYLEQSISEAITAFIVWHQRHWIFGDRRRIPAIATSALLVFHVVVFLPSRTGYLVTAVLFCISLFLHLPRRWLWAGAILSLLLTFSLLGADKPTRNDVLQWSQNKSTPSDPRDRQISTDVRLNFWSTSLKAIAERPFFGSGSGSWNREYLRVTTVDIPTYRNIRDPHQMFLLWAVEGGAIGLCLLCATLLALLYRSKSMASGDAHSLQAILLALGVAGLTTSTIYGIGMGDFFCVGIGILLNLGHWQQREHMGDSSDIA